MPDNSINSVRHNLKEVEMGKGISVIVLFIITGTMVLFGFTSFAQAGTLPEYRRTVNTPRLVPARPISQKTQARPSSIIVPRAVQTNKLQGSLRLNSRTEGMISRQRNSISELRTKQSFSNISTVGRTMPVMPKTIGGQTRRIAPSSITSAPRIPLNMRYGR